MKILGLIQLQITTFFGTWSVCSNTNISEKDCDMQLKALQKSYYVEFICQIAKYAEKKSIYVEHQFNS